MVIPLGICLETDQVWYQSLQLVSWQSGSISEDVLQGLLLSPGIFYFFDLHNKLQLIIHLKCLVLLARLTIHVLLKRKLVKMFNISNIVLDSNVDYCCVTIYLKA